MNQTRVRPMVEGGILAGIAILFALISVYIPLIGVFVNFVWPVPIILLGVRHGYRWSIMATVVAGVLIAVLLHPLHALGVAVGFGLTGIVLGHCFRRGFAPVKCLFWGGAASLVSKVFLLGVSAVVLGIDPLADHSAAMAKAVEQAMGIYRSLGMKEDDLAKMGENLKEMLALMQLIVPAGFVLASAADTYLNYVIARSVLGKLGHRIEPFPPFKLWSLPSYVLYAFIVAVLMIYWGKSREIVWLANIGLNVQIMCSMLLMVQGLSAAFFYADKYGVPKFMRWLLVFLVFTNGFILQAAVFAGAFDVALDYRKLRRAPPSDEESAP